MQGANGLHHVDGGCFNDSRTFVTAAGQKQNVSYYTERPKLLLGGADGLTPTHLYGGAGPVTKGGHSFTVVSPLGFELNK